MPLCLYGSRNRRFLARGKLMRDCCLPMRRLDLFFCCFHIKPHGRLDRLLTDSENGNPEYQKLRQLTSRAVKKHYSRKLNQSRNHPNCPHHQSTRYASRMHFWESGLTLSQGKQKAVEEPPPDSPSSLFSVDLSEEVTVPSPKSKVDIPPAPEHKLSTTYASSSTKSSSTKPSPVIPPKIPRRPVNPYSKPTESPIFAAPASGIPTKQRLSWSALAPINPKDAKTKALSTKSTSNLPDNLRFKKGSTNTVWVPDGSTMESPTIKQPELTLNALNASPMNEHPPTSILSDTALRMSPVTMESPMERPPFSPQLPQ